MKANPIKIARFALLLLALFAANTAPLHAQFNDWSNTNDGKWEDGANWTLGTPPGTNDFAENIFTGTTITIDATTSGSFPNTMTVNEVALGWPTTLYLNNAGTNTPLHILHDLDMTYASVPEVIITDSALQVDGTMLEGYLTGDAGDFELDSGWAQFGSITLGDHGNGDLFLNGGTLTVLGTTTLGASPTGAGTVEIYDGTFNNTNNSIVLGSQGVGAFNAYGGIVHALSFQIGNVAGSEGILFVSGGAVLVSSNILIGDSSVTNPCKVVIWTNGILSVTNATHTAYIDVAGNSSLTLNGGLLQLDSLILTNGGSFTDLSGTFTNTGPFQVDNGSSITVAGGTVIAPTNFTVGSVAGSTSSVSMAGGSLIVTNAPLLLGPVGVGQMTVSSGSTVTAQILTLGSAVPGSSGSLMMNDNSTLRVTSLLSINSFSSFDLPGVNVVVDGSGSTVIVGDDNNGAMRVTSATVSMVWQSMFIGYSPGVTGTYIQSAGQVIVNNNLIVGSCVTNGPEALGFVTLSGGTLYVTNSTHTAALVVGNGTFMLQSGATLVVDNLIITNACARFVNNGGTLTYGQLTLDPNLDADGDGVSNGAEILAGTDPLNPGSSFRALGVSVSDQDVIVSWTTVGGHSYVVQASNTGIANASFADVSPVINISGVGEGMTSYRHAGGAAHPAGFYRVRLGP